MTDGNWTPHRKGIAVQQIVGASCSVCEQRIAVAFDARECELCAFPVHKACYDSFVPGKTSDACPKCGADRKRTAGYVAPDTLPGGAGSSDTVGVPAQKSADGNAAPQPTSRILPNYRPLGDPLFKLRKLFGWTALLWTTATVVSWAWLLFDVTETSLKVRDEFIVGEGSLASFFVMTTVFFLPPLVFLWLILPNRKTNAFYLRSFKNDAATLPIRVAAQSALGNDFRLSGIRDPRRRLSSFHQLLSSTVRMFVFILRYSSPKYMNLEAGGDWKIRLAASLAQARCSLIDLTDLTPFVSEEIRLTYHCLGPKRILFVANSTRTEAEWREDIEKALGIPCDKAFFQITNWENSSAGRRAFRADVQTFREQLPAGEAGLSMPGSALTDSTDRKSTRLNSSHVVISYAVFCLKKKKTKQNQKIRTSAVQRRILEH